MFNIHDKNSVYVCCHTFPTAEYHHGKVFMLQPILLPEIELEWHKKLVGCAKFLEYLAYLGSHILCSNCGDPNSFFFDYSHCEFQAIVVEVIVFICLVLNAMYAKLWSTGFSSRMKQHMHQKIMALFEGVSFGIYFFCYCWKIMHRKLNSGVMQIVPGINSCTKGQTFSSKIIF